MSVQTYPWESKLIAMAQEAMQSHSSRATSFVDRKDQEILGQAYIHCDLITKEHSQTFYLASALLPLEKRRSMRALYAFCRLTDNLVDGNPSATKAELDKWRSRSLRETPTKNDLVAYAWADTRIKFDIPRKLGEQLIDGVARDLIQTRYQTFDELASYCYSVASTVGLMAMHIIGFQGPEALPYAIKLGVALQLTNILRDVGEDWQAGRLYLPQDELTLFGITEDDFEAGKVDDNWLAFLSFQIERNQQLYQEAKPGICMLHEDGRFAVTAAADLYAGILDAIQLNNGNVFRCRAVMSNFKKIRRLPSIWWQSMSCA